MLQWTIERQLLWYSMLRIACHDMPWHAVTQGMHYMHLKRWRTCKRFAKIHPQLLVEMDVDVNALQRRLFPLSLRDIATRQVALNKFWCFQSTHETYTIPMHQWKAALGSDPLQRESSDSDSFSLHMKRTSCEKGAMGSDCPSCYKCSPLETWATRWCSYRKHKTMCIWRELLCLQH